MTLAADSQWSAARNELVPFIGERATALFAHAVAAGSGESAFAGSLRRGLIDSGEDLENPRVTETERLLIDWGWMLGRNPDAIDDATRARLDASFTPALRGILVRFAAVTRDASRAADSSR